MTAPNWMVPTVTPVLGTFGRSGSAGLLFGLEHLDRDPVRVVDGYEVGAQETGGPLYPGMSSSRPRLASARSAILAWITLACMADLPCSFGASSRYPRLSAISGA